MRKGEVKFYSQAHFGKIKLYNHLVEKSHLILAKSREKFYSKENHTTQGFAASRHWEISFKMTRKFSPWWIRLLPEDTMRVADMGKTAVALHRAGPWMLQHSPASKMCPPVKSWHESCDGNKLLPDWIWGLLYVWEFQIWHCTSGQKLLTGKSVAPGW